MSNNVLGELLRHHDDNLQHVGVKGMKWGVRRSGNTQVRKINGQTWHVKGDKKDSKPKVKKVTPDEGGKKLKQLESQIKNTKDPIKRKALEKKYGEIEDSITYSKPKKTAKQKAEARKKLGKKIIKAIGKTYNEAAANDQAIRRNAAAKYNRPENKALYDRIIKG